MNPILLALITGLTSGGVSCLTVQGGLLASTLSQKDQKLTDSTVVLMFLVAKLIAYSLLGFGLGAIGSALTITPTFQGYLQIFAGLYMLATAANLLNLHPIFRYAVIQPPRFAYKYMRGQSKNGELFTPGILGALTVFIPCGITQGMMVIAVASGSAWMGAAIMMAFTLGTSPLFFALGLSAAKLMSRKSFRYIAASVVIFLGILSVNTGQALRGSSHTVQNYLKVLNANVSVPTSGLVADVNAEGKQEVSIKVANNGYSSSVQTLKVGVPVKLTLNTQSTQGCSRAFTIPTMNISKLLPESGETTIEFTPTKTGRLAYTCSMGMYSGAFTVIN